MCSLPYVEFTCLANTINTKAVQSSNVGSSWHLAVEHNGNVSGSHAFQRPYGLALDPQGNIHVATHGSNTVKVFTPEGTYVRSYGDYVEMHESPYGLSFTILRAKTSV